GQNRLVHRLVRAIELQRSRADRTYDRRRHARLDNLPHQVAWAPVGHEARRHFDARFADAVDALGGVTHPAAAGDVVVETGVAVDENIDAGAVLSGDVAGETIEMLLAVSGLGQTMGERYAAQIGVIPTRPRQRPGRGGEQGLALGRREHAAA